MKLSQTTAVTVLGIKVAVVEVSREFAETRGSERRESHSTNITPVDADFVTPILAQAVKLSTQLSPNEFSFVGDTLTVNGNIDTYTACQELKKKFTESGAVNVVFGVAATANAYNKADAGGVGVFYGHIMNIVKENWEPQEASKK